MRIKHCLAIFIYYQKYNINRNMYTVIKDTSRSSTSDKYHVENLRLQIGDCKAR